MVRYHLKVVLKQKLLWLLLFGSFVPALFACLGVYLGWRNGFGEMELAFASLVEPGEPRTQAENYDLAARLASVGLLVQAQSFFVLSVTSLVGSRLIARDLRANAMELYLTKPITRGHYLTGKLAVIAYFIFIVTFAPVMLVWVVASGLLEGFASSTLHLIPRVFLVCAVIAVVNGSVILALSSLARSSRYATIIWFALCFLSLGTARILEAVTEVNVFSLVSYRDTFGQFVVWVMDVDPMEELGLRGRVPFFATLSVMALYFSLSIAIVRRTLRGVIQR